MYVEVIQGIVGSDGGYKTESYRPTLSVQPDAPENPITPTTDLVEFPIGKKINETRNR